MYRKKKKQVDFDVKRISDLELVLTSKVQYSKVKKNGKENSHMLH